MPPVSLVIKVIRHVSFCQCKGIFVVPYWPSAPFWPFLVERGGVFRAFVRDFALSRTVEMFSSTGRIKVLSLVLRILVHQFCFCCSMELFSSGQERLVIMGCWLLGYNSQLSWWLNIKGHWAMQFCGLLGVLITFLRPLGHAVQLRAIGCVDHIFEAAGPYFACICVFVTLNGRWAAVFILYAFVCLLFL